MPEEAHFRETHPLAVALRHLGRHGTNTAVAGGGGLDALASDTIRYGREDVKYRPSQNVSLPGQAQQMADVAQAIGKTRALCTYDMTLIETSTLGRGSRANTKRTRGSIDSQRIAADRSKFSCFPPKLFMCFQQKHG